DSVHTVLQLRVLRSSRTRSAVSAKSGALEAAIESAFELAIERDHASVEEGQDLGEQRTCDLLHRVEPEIAIEQTRPGRAARAAASRTARRPDFLRADD